MFGAYVVLKGIIDPIDSSEGSDGKDDECFGLEVNLVDDE